MKSESKMTEQRIDNENTVSASGSGYVVGVDIGGTNLRLALADMTGAIVARWSSSTAGSRGADAIIDLICNGVMDCLQQVSVSRSALAAIAAGAPGITDVDAGIVIATSYLLGWQDVPLRDMFEAALGIPAAVDNDVNLAAIGESRAGAAIGVNDFVFLAIGTGIGAGIVLNGKPFRGMGWSAGEVGYMLVPGVPERPADHGKPGSLEGIVGGEGIKTEWQRQWTRKRTILEKHVTATEIFDAALKGDQLAQIVLEQSARILAYAVYNMSLMLNCPLFVLGGGVGMHPALENATRHILEQWNRHGNMKLTRSLLGPDAQLVGAIHLALATAKTRQTVSAASVTGKLWL